MMRDRLQNWLLAAAVAALLLTIAQIYQVFMARTPANLKGNIAVEGGMTANPPAGTGSAPPSMQ
jgi:hypothetical protein